MNVLIVDDEPLELEQVAFLIHRRYPHWNVYQAEDAAQAKRIAEAQSIPLAFIDIHMPGESGLLLAGLLKERNPMMEIVIITAYQDFDYAKQAIKLDVLDYLVKPLIEAELLKAIDTYLERHPEKRSRSPYIDAVIDKIHGHYSERLNLQTMAEEIHVNGPYLSKRFAEEVGMNFKDYLIRYRIKKAKELLCQKPDWNIARIAEEVGFASQHHFSNSFRKTEGITPTQYKEKMG